MDNLIEILKNKLGGALVSVEPMPNNDLMAVVHRRRLVHSLGILKNDPELGFTTLMNHLGVECPDSFAVIYNLYSGSLKRKMTVKTLLERENPVVDSAIPVFRGIDWFERETYDLLGIRFRGHGNLKRILLPPEWEGHPLRKDYVAPEEFGGIDNRRTGLAEGREN